MPEDESNFQLTLTAEDDEEEAGNDWITTFADLCMLLLVFFILLFSMSTLDTEKFSESFLSVKKALSGEVDLRSAQKVISEQGAILDQVMMQRQIREAQQKVFSDVQFFQTTNGLEGVIGAHYEDGVITLRAPSDVLFDSGRVTLKPEGKRVLSLMKGFFAQHVDQIINIRGHSDNVAPGPGSRFKDNWEISAMRAVNVLRFLVEEGMDPDRMTATGLADLEPLFPNTSAVNRAKNRRVEFVLERQVSGKP
ncbi:MAG: OmpA/MotB family protein [Desulfovibrionaceae bacterium]